MIPDVQYEIIREEPQLTQYVERMYLAPVIGLDLETTGLNTTRDQIVGIALSPGPGRAAYIPVRHMESGQMAVRNVLEILKPFLESTKQRGQTIVVHNPKFDTSFLRRADIRIPDDAIHDTMLETFASGAGHTRLGLKPIAKSLFDADLTSFNDLFPPETTRKSIGDLAIDHVGPYGCQDADWCLRLHFAMFPHVRDNLHYIMENMLWPILRDVEMCGVGFDLETHRKMVSDVLSMTPRMIQIAEAFPTRQNIAAQNALTQFVMALDRDNPANHIGIDGRLHPNYRQVATIDGRCITDTPCLETNIRYRRFSVSAEDGNELSFAWAPKSAYKADSGNYLMEVSIRQPEILILASMAGDTQTLDAYQQFGDIHRATAGRLMRVPISQVQSRDRTRTKWAGYRDLYAPPPGGEDCIFPVIREFQQRLVKENAASQRITTCTGRSMPIVSDDMGKLTRHYAQGSASDIAKLIVLRANQVIKSKYDSEAVRLVAFVNGALLLEVSSQVRPWELSATIKTVVESIEPRFPFKSDIKVGLDWENMQAC